MKRPTLTTFNTFAIAVGAVVLLLAMSGCATIHPMSDDAIAAVVPSGRGAH